MCCYDACYVRAVSLSIVSKIIRVLPCHGVEPTINKEVRFCSDSRIDHTHLDALSRIIRRVAIEKAQTISEYKIDWEQREFFSRTDSHIPP